MPRRFISKFKLPAAGVSLADEPEDVKGVRMLRFMRHFVKSKSGVMSLEVDGQLIVFVKYHQGKHPNADTTSDGAL